MKQSHSPLEFVETELLITELFRRSTFKGVLVHSIDSHRYSGQLHSKFRLLTTLRDEDTVDLLAMMIQKLSV